MLCEHLRRRDDALSSVYLQSVAALVQAYTRARRNVEQLAQREGANGQMCELVNLLN